MNRVDPSPSRRPLVRLGLAGAILIVGIQCNSTPTSTASTPRVCSAAKDCATCLETNGELCIWCAATASCRSYPSACESGGGNHGYFTDSQRFSIQPADATAICNLPCSVNGEVLVDSHGHGTFNPGRCCSSSQPSSGQNGSSCSPSNTGEACAKDTDCVEPETCQGGVCVGTPATNHVVCDHADDACNCHVESTVDAGAQTSCNTQLAPGTVCCAASGWPNPDPGSGGSCVCRAPWPCYKPADFNCACGPEAKNYQGTSAAVTSCTGKICCTDKYRTTCSCDVGNVDTEGCAIVAGEGAVRVPSCDNAVIGCPSTTPPYSSVASCYEPPPVDAGSPDGG